MTELTDRGLLLYDQGRYDLAESELRRALAAEPNDAMAHSLLGLCLMQRQRFQDAADEAATAIRLEPDLAFAHWAQAQVFEDRNRLDEAERSATEAVRLAPEYPGFRALLAGIQLNRGHADQALTTALEALRLDPEHVGAANIRAMALVRLGRDNEAQDSIATALRLDPDNALTHANQGWARLHAGEHSAALESFKEALRLDPTDDWARAGLVEALKARYPVYGWLLRYFLWMSRLDPRFQWGFYIGAWILIRVFRPLAIPWIAFIWLTWVADPLFNLLLRLNRYGRYALSPDQIRGSNLVGVCLAGTVVALALGAVTGSMALLLLGAACAVLMVPVAAIYNCEAGWPRLLMTLVTAGLALAGLAGVLLAGSGGGSDAAGVFVLFLFGGMASTWIAAWLTRVQPKR
jgi:tetratricopeptide (TPR) repeat protein